MGIRSLYKRAFQWWQRWEHVLNSASYIIGFGFDLMVAKRPDAIFENILLLSYLCIAGSFIIILNLHLNRRRSPTLPDGTPRPAPLFLLLILQFCFGGLSSNMLVLYGKSGTFAGSALFFVVLLGVMVGNEFLRSRYAHLRFNIVVYYFLLFMYLTIAVPTFIFHSVGTLVFLATGVMSLGLIAGFLWIVYMLVLRGRDRENQLYEVSVLVGLVFLFFNALYFLQIIPPVPLGLKNIGIYHSLTRLPSAGEDGQALYKATYEPAAWFEFWRDTSGTFNAANGSEATCFSSVFAPTDLTAPIVHVWERYDESAKRWKESFRVSFPINGGRDEGYRGFSHATVSPGRWRCDVKTESGALIGRFTFTVKAGSTPALSQKTL